MDQETGNSNIEEIKRHLSLFDKRTVIESLIKVIRSKDFTPIMERMQGYHPWKLLMLLSLTYENHICSANPINDKSLFELLRLGHNYNSHDGTEYFTNDSPYAMHKAIRLFAHHQFEYQSLNLIEIFGRQWHLAKLMSNNVDIRDLCYEILGVDYQEWLAACLLIFSITKEEGIRYFPDHFFKDLFVSVDRSKKFFSGLSYNFIYDRFGPLRSSKKIDKEEFDYLGAPRLIKKPMIRTSQGNSLVISLELFLMTVHNLLRMLIKEKENEKIINIYSTTFEQYIAKELKIVCRNFKNEKEISKLIKDKNCKKTDFLVLEDEMNIMIEVKTARVQRIAQIYQFDNVMVDFYKRSIIDAVQQGYHLARKLSIQKLVSSNNYSLLIVTYEKTYLQSGLIIWEEFIKSSIENTGIGIDDLNRLNPERIFVLSVDEFDLLIHTLKLLDMSFSTFIHKIVCDNRNNESAKAFVYQHLLDFLSKSDKPKSYVNRYLEAGFDEISDFIKSKGISMRQVENCRFENLLTF